MDPSKLKVIELRAELAARGLDIKGVKAVLVERLSAALEEDGGQISEESSEPPEEILPDDQVEESPKLEYERDVALQHEDVSIIPDDDEEEEDDDEVEEVLFDEPTNLTKQIEIIPDKVKTDDNIDLNEMEDQSVSNSSLLDDKIDDIKIVQSISKEQEDDIAEEDAEMKDVTNEEIEKNNIDINLEENLLENQEENVDKAEVNKDEEQHDDIEKSDVDKNEERDTKTDSEKESRDTSDRRRRSNDDRRRKRQRSGSPQRRDSRRSPPRNPPPVQNSDDFAIEEDEPVLDENAVTLNWYDSDLNLKIHTDDFLSARPLSDVALGLVWAGARSTHGVKNGRVLYEIQIVGQNNFSNSFPDSNNVHELMCGWSTITSSLQLGESSLSFAYGGLGKKAINNVFTDYGCKLRLHDIIGIYLDLDSSPCTIEYTVNGVSQGIAFEFDKTELGDDALFPHINSKNVSYKVNFGQHETFLKRVKPKSTKVVTTPKKDTKMHEKKDTTEIENDDTKLKENKKDDVESKEEGTDEKKVDGEEKKDESVMEEEKKEVIDEEIAIKEVEETEKKDDEDVDMTKVPEDTVIADEVTDDKLIEHKKEEETLIEEKEEQIELHLLPDYIYVCKISEELLISGPRRPETRKDCEVILLVGLPGAGKTHWAINHVKENIDKRYNILGTQTLLERMRFSGENKNKFVGRWEKLIEWCTRSLIVLQEIACKRRRNYILDQTNVYASAQRRKMRGFGEFKRIAVIIIPDDEEYKRRYEKKIESEGKEVPDVAVNEMKANFALPSIEFGWFTEVTYTELDGEAAKTAVTDYNEKGRQALPPQQPSKRRRYNERDNNRRDNNNRNNNRDHQQRHHQRWNGPMDRRGGRGDRWGPGPPPGRWGGGGGGFDRRDRIPWGGGGGPGNWMPNKRGPPRFDDRGYRGPPPMGGRNDRDRRDFRGGDRGPPRGQPSGGGSGGGRNGGGGGRDDKKGPKDLMSKSGDSRNGSKGGYGSGGSQGNWGPAGNWGGSSGSSQGQYGNWGGYGQNYNQGYGNNWSQGGGGGGGGYGGQWSGGNQASTQNSGSSSAGGTGGQWKNYGTTSQSQSSSTGASGASSQSTQQHQQLQQQQWMNWWQQQQQLTGGSTGGNNSDPNMAAWQNWAQYAQAYYNNPAAGSQQQQHQQQTNQKSQSILDSNKK